MLQDILLNFSEDELLEFLPSNSVDFSIEVLSGEGDKTFLNSKELAGVVSITQEVNFIFSDVLRSRLIERMPPDLFVKIFPEFHVSVFDLKPEHYDAAILWSNENLEGFSSKLELKNIYMEQMSGEAEIKRLSLIEPSYALYPYQQDISKKVFRCFEEGNTRVLVHLPTGSGKTRTAMNIAAEHLRESPSNVVLWLADREELCQQAYDEFEKAWTSLGNRATPVYGFYSDSDESLGGVDSGFVVAGLHKFISLRKTNSRKLQLLYDELKQAVTLVIFDESHKAVAPVFSQVVNDFISGMDLNAKLIGLTATPGRSFSLSGLSEEDQNLADFFHNNKISMSVPGYISPIDYLVENGYLAKANFKSLNYDHSAISAYELKDSGGIETMKALSNNIDRNRKILDTVIMECEQGSQIILFACTVEHGVNLATALACKGIRAASIDSKNDTIESRRIKIQQYKEKTLQVLVNYNVLTAGFDAPDTNVSVIAKPMNSLVQYLQMAGRAMRGHKSGGNKECTIYTVMDDIPEFQSINLAFEYWNDMWVDKEKS